MNWHNLLLSPVGNRNGKEEMVCRLKAKLYSGWLRNQKLSRGQSKGQKNKR